MLKTKHYRIPGARPCEFTKCWAGLPSPAPIDQEALGTDRQTTAPKVTAKEGRAHRPLGRPEPGQCYFWTEANWVPPVLLPSPSPLPSSQI